jgi:hypothetical protein
VAAGSAARHADKKSPLPPHVYPGGNGLGSDELQFQRASAAYFTFAFTIASATFVGVSA